MSPSTIDEVISELTLEEKVRFCIGHGIAFGPELSAVRMHDKKVKTQKLTSKAL